MTLRTFSKICTDASQVLLSLLHDSNRTTLKCALLPEKTDIPRACHTILDWSPSGCLTMMNCVPQILNFETIPQTELNHAMTSHTELRFRFTWFTSGAKRKGPREFKSSRIRQLLNPDARGRGSHVLEPWNSKVTSSKVHSSAYLKSDVIRVQLRVRCRYGQQW